ncbi:MAG: DUF4292 domain-containing protein [Bacteroidota bacterium]
MLSIPRLSLLLGILGLLLIAPACKSSKKAGTALQLKKRSARFLVKKLEEQKVDVDWLSAKARIGFRDENRSVKVTANIRLRKDSILWMNFKKLSVEVARVLITPDSIYLIDRHNKQYTIQGFDFLERQFNMPAAIAEEAGAQATGFNSMQQLLLGNPPLPPNRKYKASIDDQAYQLNRRESGFDSYYWLEGLNLLLSRMRFLDLGFDREVEMELEDYKSVNEEQNFSYFRRLNLKSPDTGDISMSIKFLKVEINTPKRIRFDIPSNYKKMD